MRWVDRSSGSVWFISRPSISPRIPQVRQHSGRINWGTIPARRTPRSLSEVGLFASRSLFVSLSAPPPPPPPPPVLPLFAWLVECCFTSTETVGLLGTGAQDGHLDFHTAPELCPVFAVALVFLWVGFCLERLRWIFIYIYMHIACAFVWDRCSVQDNVFVCHQGQIC